MESTDRGRWGGEWTDDPGVGAPRAVLDAQARCDRTVEGGPPLFATDPQWPRVILSTVGILRTRHARVLPKIRLAAAYFRGSEPSSLPRFAR